MDTLDALRRRISTRAYLDRPVDTETVTAILDAARWSPSGGNLQPWDVAVVSGAAKRRVCDAMLAARAAGEVSKPDYSYYPTEWVEPYKGRRRACGLALYEAQGIGRNDEAKRLEAWNANYRFFDAPTALFFFLDRRMSQGAWLDAGMFMQSVMLAATSMGLGTCPEASVSEYPDIVRRELDRNDDAILLAGIALGYADPIAAVNNYRTEREPVEGFAKFYS